MKENRERGSLYDYGCIFVMSYGMTKDKEGGYHPTFYSGMAAKAAADLLLHAKAPRIVVESANIFPGVSLNDGNLMSDLLVRFGVPKGAITVRPNNKNSYLQVEDMAEYRERFPQDVLTVCAGFHEHRVRTLLKKHHVKSHVTTIEDVLRNRWKRSGLWNREVVSGHRQGDSIRKFIDELEDNPDYGKSESVEDLMTTVSRFDRDDFLAKIASNLSFPFKGADIADVRRRRHVRTFAKSFQNGKRPNKFIIAQPFTNPPIIPAPKK